MAHQFGKLPVELPAGKKTSWSESVRESDMLKGGRSGMARGHGRSALWSPDLGGATGTRRIGEASNPGPFGACCVLCSAELRLVRAVSGMNCNSCGGPPTPGGRVLECLSMCWAFCLPIEHVRIPCLGTGEYQFSIAMDWVETGNRTRDASTIRFIPRLKRIRYRPL